MKEILASKHQISKELPGFSRASVKQARILTPRKLRQKRKVT